MTRKISRREFVRTGAVAGLAASVGPRYAPARAAAPTPPSKPVVIASANGHQFRNGGPRTCVEEAFERLVRGEDVLDAILAGLTIVELDPADDSVGFGGLPNADGVVQLDASCMHGARKRLGAVAALEGVRTPSLVAKEVFERTDHHLLVGKGAQDFARRLGFKIEDDLNTDRSRAKWLEWKRRTDPEHWIDAGARAEAGDRARRSMIADGLLDPDRAYGTIHCGAVSARGGIAGATTTSGLAWKIPGRVGDSPIPGAGLWVDGAVGSAGSTGRGEANLYHVSSHAIVEAMRRGAHPKDAALEALRRVRESTTESRLRNARGEPNFQLKFYAVNARGEHAGVALYAEPAPVYAVCDASGPRLVAMDFLLPGRPDDTAARP